jgi:hypothetical protein
MGRKLASGLVGLLLVGGLLTGCNKCCRQGFLGGKSIQDTPSTFGAVGNATGRGESWGQAPRRLGEAPPPPTRAPGAMQVSREGSVGRMPAAPARGSLDRALRTVGAESDGMGGVQQAGFESDPGRMTPPPAPPTGVNTEAHRPVYQGHQAEMGAASAEMSAGRAPNFRFPPAPVSSCCEEESSAETGDFASSPPPPPAAPGGSVDELPPPPAESAGVPPETIHSVPGGTSEPAPLPPPFPPGN